MKFVFVHCIKGKVNHSALSLKINLCYNPNFILFHVPSPRNSFTTPCFFLGNIFFLDMQSCSIMFSFVLQEADFCSGGVFLLFFFFFVLFCFCVFGFLCVFVVFCLFVFNVFIEWNSPGTEGVSHRIHL